VFRQVVERTALPIQYGCRVEGIDSRSDGLLAVRTSAGVYQTRQVLLAIGRRGSPQKLGVPGEELPNVAYRLKDPEEYAGTRCLVVGGGDAAVEAAVALASQQATQVSLAYRGDSIWRAKKENLTRLDEAVRGGRLQLFLNAKPVQIRPDSVSLDVAGSVVHLFNDYVFVFAGGVVPTRFLQSAGIAMRTVHGEQVSAL
jgi:dihydropyrimidine dehydrogenase (NAD+) subunit PreT